MCGPGPSWCGAVLLPSEPQLKRSIISLPERTAKHGVGCQGCNDVSIIHKFHRVVAKIIVSYRELLWSIVAGFLLHHASM